MKTRMNWMAGVAAIGVTSIGLGMIAPVHAASVFFDSNVMVAQRDRVDESRQDPRADRKDSRPAPKREYKREEAPGYGYGYERRQQERNEPDGRPRDRH